MVSRDFVTMVAKVLPIPYRDSVTVLHPMKMYFGKLLSVVIMIVYVGAISVGAQVISKFRVGCSYPFGLLNWNTGLTVSIFLFCVCSTVNKYS